MPTRLWPTKSCILNFAFAGHLGRRNEGRKGFITYLRMIHTALSKYTCSIEEIVEEGQRVAARMRFAGIHRGQFFGVAPSGREISWSGAAFFAIDGDKIYQPLGTWRH